MRKTSFFCGVRGLVPLIACMGLPFSAVHNSLLAQTTATEESVVVTAEEVPSAYGAPPGLSRSRLSNTVNAYVLPPWSFFFGELYEGQGFRHGPPDHLFTQEIEMGLPYRFNVAAEAGFERFNGGGGAQTVSLEARWALADWNKIPLNPTLFAEYKFGVGTIRHEEVPPPPGGGEEEESGPPKVPDAYEVRLLLAQEFFGRIEWAMNWFFEKENTGDRGREWGFSQAAMTPVLLPNERLKVGIEMEYKNVTTKDTRGDPVNSFTIGPTVAWKPTASTRLDISPLFGCTHDSPIADVFVAFSWLFGGERAEAEAPVSTRFRYYTDAAYSHSGKDSGKEMKQVAYVPPCPQWYGDREWNVNLWGTYASITIIPSALSLAHLRCGIQFRARVWRRMHGRVWARFSAAAKGTLFTRKDRRTHSLLMHRRSISAAKPRCSANLGPVSNFELRGILV